MEGQVAQSGDGTFSVAARLLRFSCRGEGRRIVPGVAAMLLGTLVSLLGPWPLKLVLDCVLSSHDAPLKLNLLARWMGGDHWRLALLGILCGALLLVHVLAAVLTVWSTSLLVSVGLRMVFKLRCALFDHIQRLSLRFHDQTPVGDSLYRVTFDSCCAQAIFNSGLIPAISAVVTLAGIGVALLTRDWLVMICAAGVAVLLGVLVRAMDRPMRERSMRVHERESQIGSRVQETLLGIRAVQAFGREELESERFRDQARLSLHETLRLTVLQTSSQAVVGLLLAAATALMVWVSAWRVLQGRLTVGDVLLIVSYMAMLLRPLEMLAYTAMQLQGSAAGARRVFGILDARPEVQDEPEAQELPRRSSGSIEFDDVSFGYGEGELVIRDMWLRIREGETVALVGASGAGKTTLVSLLMRFYDPAEGVIRLGGLPLRKLTLRSLRENIALVLQEPVLFSATIAENIAYGRPGASLEEIRGAAEAAGASEFIEQLPDGYQTQIGERGARLSGGQRQRISIARAFLKDAPVLVMDEPTSALDATTEAGLLDSLERLRQGRTTIIIAHRLSTIRSADRIVAMRDGKIVEAGTHLELIESGGVYARLHAAQSGEIVAEVGHG